MTKQVTANTPEEVHLLHLFRQLSPMCTRYMLLQAQTCFDASAEYRRAAKPRLSLVVSEKHRSTDTEVSA
jgi:hypothetical protein